MDPLPAVLTPRPAPSLGMVLGSGSSPSNEDAKPDPPAAPAAAEPDPCPGCGARPDDDSRETPRCGPCYLAWSRARGLPHWSEMVSDDQAEDEDDESED